MDLGTLHLNQLPHHLDVAVFFGMSIIIALALGFGVKTLSDMMARTDRIAAEKARQAALQSDESLVTPLSVAVAVGTQTGQPVPANVANTDQQVAFKTAA